jgi:hypothetical protein
MPTSIREQLLDAITTAVDGQFGVPDPGDLRDLPVTIVDDGEEVAEDTVYNQTNVELPIVVAKAAESSSTARETMRQEANELLASIITDMFADETFGGLADGVSYTGGEIQTEVGKFVFAQAQFAVRYHFDHGDPYSSS